MSLLWLQPMAFWGLAACLLPVLIHLLVRQQSRRVAFPSLRFLRPTRLAALRQWRIADALLLAARLLILATAVAALAAPVIISGNRWRSWNARVARAIVLVPAGPGPAVAQPDDREIAPLVARARESAFRSTTLAPATHLRDGLREAVAWLDRQPPAAREVVVVGNLREGAATAGDLFLVPTHVGLAWLPTTDAPGPRRARLSAITNADGQPRARELRLTLDDHATAVEYLTRTGAEVRHPLEVSASAADQPRADAALRAVLGEGILVPRGEDKRVMIAFEDAGQLAMVQPAPVPWMRRVLEQLPEVTGGERDGRLLVVAGMPAADPRALRLIADVAATAFADDLRDLEPRLIPLSVLAAWSRPPLGAPPDVTPQDEGDRRWFWLGVLVLLAVEQWIRRGARQSHPAQVEPSVAPEVRVA